MKNHFMKSKASGPVKSVKSLKAPTNERPVGIGRPLKSYAGFQNASKVHFTRLLVRMIVGAVAGMNPVQSVLATDCFSTQTAGKGQTLTLNPGDTVTLAGANQEGIVATNTGILNASGVMVRQQGLPTLPGRPPT